MEERKPYHIISYGGNMILKKGIDMRTRNHGAKPGGHDSIELLLSDEEASRYDRNKVLNILEPYLNIMKKRWMYIPRELMLYAIEEVIYGTQEEINKKENKQAWIN